ncbi:MAG: FAD:protein FMN transferase [Tepidisphaerales bacterium]
MLEFHHLPFTAMGTACNLHLYADGRAAVDEAMHAAVAEVGRIEARYSRYRPDSVLSEINRAAGCGGEIAVDAETAGLLDYAWACYLKSEGLFDISSGILRRAWDFKSSRLPEQEAIAALLPRLGLDKVVWEKPLLRFGVPGMELDFGGMGKEYAADRAAAICLARGIRHGLVDLGGDITVIGPHPNGDPWRIGIQHPGRPGVLMANVEISQGALASSGDYERCITVDGKRYGHILDPRTGWPVHGLSSVSALAGQCIIAGSVCTIAMLRGAGGISWLQSLNVPHFWMDDEGKQGGTPHFSRAPA